MDATIGQASPARVYDERFVPAVFAPWASAVVAGADLGAGERVLDVACGTGALTFAAAALAGERGEVVGLDANPEMLAVARAKPSGITWIDGVAEELPFPDASFDAVLSQFGMMFFDDAAKALREMMRVLRPGGRLAVAVCDAVANSPGYGALARLLDDMFGTEIGDAFRAPFVLGDPDRLEQLAIEAGIAGATIDRLHGDIRFSSVADLVSAERACAWTLGGLLDDGQFERLLDRSETTLRPFVASDGAVVFDMPVLVLAARKMAL